jgi:hypothetical protein
MSSNKKSFEVTLSSGEVKTLPANDVQVSGGRVTFVGFVEGRSTGFDNDVVESFRAELVDSFRLVPVAEEDAKAEGKNVYRFNFTDGTSKEVRGDYITHAPGADGKPGRYSVATRLNGRGGDRSEYLVPEDRVADIERVNDGETVTAVPAQADAAKA